MTGQPRSTQRSTPPAISESDETLVCELKRFALSHPRRGYKRAYRALKNAGWNVNLKRVHRLWRSAGLKVPYKKKRKPYQGKGVSMGSHHPTATNICWAMDFLFDQSTDTSPIKILNITDEYSREYLASLAARSISAKDVLAALDDLLAIRGRPLYLRVDHGPEFLAEVIANWCEEVGTTLWLIAPGSPWEDGKVESLNSRVRDEMLNGELFESVTEAQILLDRYRAEYNLFRPHSSLGYLSPQEFLALSVLKQRHVLVKSSRGTYFWDKTSTREAA